MTPTEKLLQRQDEIIDQIRVIEPDFYYVESCYGRQTLKSIKAAIQRLEQYLENIIEKREVEKFYATEEGQNLKEELESSKEELATELDNLNETYKNEVHQKIMSVLDENEWTIQANPESIEIGLKEIDEKRLTKGFTMSFGETFTIYNFHIFSRGDKPLEINYGTCGSFNPLESRRSQYLLGMATFVNSFETLKELKVILDEWYDKQRQLFRKLDAIAERLKNPLKF